MYFNFSYLKFHEFASKFDLIFNVFQICQNALKTKTSLEVHFRRDNVLRRIFYFFPHRKKTPQNRAADKFT